MASGSFEVPYYSYTTTANWKVWVEWNSYNNLSENSSFFVANLYVENTYYSSMDYTVWMDLYDENGNVIEHLYIDKVFHRYDTINRPVHHIEQISKTIKHKADGTGVAGVWVHIKNYWMPTTDYFETNKPVYVQLDTNEYNVSLLSAQNFTDETNPTITYSNTMGKNIELLQACISFTGDKVDIAYRDIPKTGTSYTFNLTEAEREVLRQETIRQGTNPILVRFYIRWKTDAMHTRYITKNFLVADAAPSFSVVFSENDGECANLTLGNTSDVYIKGFSDMYFHISDAEAKKGATIAGYKTYIGDTSSSETSGVLENFTGNKLVFEVSDNRGNTSKKEFDLDVVDYFPITCSFVSSEVVMNDDGETATSRITVKGEFFNSTFGDKGVKNTMKIEQYDTSTDSWWEIPDILWGDGISGNKYEASFNATIPYNQSLTLQYRASDKLTSATTDSKTLRLNPVFDWGEDDFRFNVPVEIKGDLTVHGKITTEGETEPAPADYVIETGTEAMGTNGTWYWSKWKSGKAECYGVRNFGNMGISTAWGNLFEAGPFYQDFPDGLFASAPDVINMNIRNAESGVFIEVGTGVDLLSASRTSNFYVVRATSRTISQVHICFNVIGRWK